MRIRIDPYNEKSIAEALKMIKQYKRDFEAKEKEFLERLGKIGVSVATTGFAVADYDGDKGEITVELVPSGKRVFVMASGEKIGFIEFGTGVRYPEWDNSGMLYTPDPHGTYGKGQGANPKGWYFTGGDMAFDPSKNKTTREGTHTFGNPPAEAMRTARDVMVERVVQIAREVWR